MMNSYAGKKKQKNNFSEFMAANFVDWSHVSWCQVLQLSDAVQTQNLSRDDRVATLRETERREEWDG